MNKKIVWIVVLVVIVAVIWALVPKNTTPVATKGTIKIGTLLCQTGPCAEWAENSLNGIQLAVDEINAAGGVNGKQLVVVAQDSAETSPVNAINGYRSLVTSGVQYIIGPTWTAAGIALAPVASQDKGKVVITSPSLGVADFNEAGDNIFNLWPHDDLASRALARYAYSKGVKKMAVFGSKEAWYTAQADAFSDEFKKAGGTIVLREDQDTKNKDVRTIATKIKGANADAVLYTNFDNMGLMAKALRDLGYKNPQYAVLMDETRVTSAQGALEDAIYAQYAPAAQNFQDTYQKRFGKKPGVTADNAYDVVKLYAKAFKDAGTEDVAKVNAVLSAYKTFSGVSGNVVFDGKGGVTKAPVFWTVKDSKLVQVK